MRLFVSFAPRLTLRASRFTLYALMRAVSSLLFAVLAVGCSDSPASLHRSSLRLALAPQFSAKAQEIYKSLSALDITLDNVHVVVRAEVSGAPGPVLKDTTIAFPATADQVTIDLEVPIQGAQQDIAAMVDLRSGTTAYFSGTQDFVAKQGETATAPQPVELNYVGPGSTAATIAVAPQPATLAPSTSFQFTALVLDPQEQTVGGLPLSWSTADSTIATVSQTGVVTATAKAGLTTLVVTGLNGIVGQATINVQPVVRLGLTGGDKQIGIVGVALPTKLQVQAFDANGDPVIGATINFAAVGGGSVSPLTATTDVSGIASTTVTLGTTTGAYAFTATLAGTPNVTTRAASNATAGPVKTIAVIDGANQLDSVLATLKKPLVAKATDAYGNAVPQQPIDFQVSAGQAGLVAVPGTAPATLVHTVTDSSGLAQVTVVGSTLAGTVTVVASAPQTTSTTAGFTEQLQAGAAKLLAVIQQPSAAVQATLPLGIQPKVQVMDSYGNSVALSGLTISVSPSVDCSLSPCDRLASPRGTSASLNRSRLRPTTALSASRINVPTITAKTRSVSDTFPQGIGGTTQVTTDARGVATFTDLSLNLSTGAWQLNFFDANESLTPAVSNDITLSPGPIESIVAWGLPDTSFVSLTVDTLSPASVRVIDKVGNGIPGVPVTWDMPGVLSALDSTKTTTDANGVASAGRWIFSFALGSSFAIRATPTPSNIENSPLTLSAFIQVIGRVVPPRFPSTPP